MFEYAQAQSLEIELAFQLNESSNTFEFALFSTPDALLAKGNAEILISLYFTSQNLGNYKVCFLALFQIQNYNGFFPAMTGGFF